MIGTDFYFGGKSSKEMDTYIVRTTSGLVQVPFLSEREIISESIPGNPVPYVFDVQDKPLQVKLTLASFNEPWTIEKRRKIARWLDNKKFNEFFSEDDPNKRYYLMYQGGIDLNLDSELYGYIEVSFQNISPFTYSPTYIETFDFSTITSPTIFELTNLGDEILKPELWIYKVGNGDVTIRNLSDGGKEFKFTSLVDKETVYVDNNNHYIETDLTDTYRHDNFNGNYLELPEHSINHLEVTGACELKFVFEYAMKG